ncbi:hypothetical protein J6590_010380 [Homalodisca vitripennis]|nr:hypothetical protein J6590_010380 [Homalodisca vitripennis]
MPSELLIVEVLEADVKCLRVELRRAETLARRRPVSVDDSLLLELKMADTTPSPEQETTDMPATCSVKLRDDHDPAVSSPAPKPRSSSPDPQDSSGSSDFNHVLLIGNSHMRYASKECVSRGIHLECCPEGKILT